MLRLTRSSIRRIRVRSDAHCRLFLAVALAVAGGASCGKGVGEPCQITGSGFHARDPCRSKCLSRWAVTCPDGRDTVLEICAGESGCTPGSCASGQACYTFNDPFEERSYCLPDNACGQVSAESVVLWERTSQDRAAATRAKYQQKKSRRTTSPAPVDPDAAEQR